MNASPTRRRIRWADGRRWTNARRWAASFRILDNGTKWKDMPRRYVSKSAVHRYFQQWVQDGVFERNRIAQPGCCSVTTGWVRRSFQS
ncbi:MAG: transposase [Planctomycetes bacterium]|nr:transposase [Planctomycetota bacterium]NOG55497.1 transposase [Planctomycetota bacterium]